jgi:hypothetical protein
MMDLNDSEPCHIYSEAGDETSQAAALLMPSAAAV